MPSIDIHFRKQTISVRSPEGEEHLKKVADLVQETLEENALQHPNLASEKIAILAAFEIASEYLKFAAEDQSLRKENLNRASDLLSKVESRIGELEQRQQETES